MILAIRTSLEGVFAKVLTSSIEITLPSRKPALISIASTSFAKSERTFAGATGSVELIAKAVGPWRELSSS